MTYTVSPFFMFSLADGTLSAVDLTQPKAYKNLSGSLVPLALQLLDSAADQTIPADIIDQALAIGLLVPSDAASLPATSLWERSHWSTAAYLIYSEMDRPYLEDRADTANIADTNDLRRLAMQKRLQSASPPQVQPAPENLIDLPTPAIRDTPNLNALFTRSSCRAFSPEPITAQQLSNLLANAFMDAKTARTLRDSSSDPLDLVRFSLFSWLDPHIIVQGVAGADPGHYRYHVVAHQLERLGPAPSNQSLAATIQNQTWIGGGGIVLYLVVNWPAYQWPYVDSRAYTVLHMELGRAGQMIYQAAYELGLAGWGTPAIAEDLAATMLGIDAQTHDAMYFLKIGTPK